VTRGAVGRRLAGVADSHRDLGSSAAGYLRPDLRESCNANLCIMALCKILKIIALDSGTDGFTLGAQSR
jgi:hypothetical protein